MIADTRCSDCPARWPSPVGAEVARLAEALVLIMDHIPDHDIQAETGFSDEVCARIAETRRAALELLK